VLMAAATAAATSPAPGEPAPPPRADAPASRTPWEAGAKMISGSSGADGASAAGTGGEGVGAGEKRSEGRMTGDGLGVGPGEGCTTSNKMGKKRDAARRGGTSFLTPTVLAGRESKNATAPVRKRGYIARGKQLHAQKAMWFTDCREVKLAEEIVLRGAAHSWRGGRDLAGLGGLRESRVLAAATGGHTRREMTGHRSEKCEEATDRACSSNSSRWRR